MVYKKDNQAPFFGKGIGNKIIGAAKGSIRTLDNDAVNGAITALVPELGLGLAVARKVGLLEKYKN